MPAVSGDFVSMRSAPRAWLPLIVVLPTLLVFARPLFRDEQFAYRDAGSFYYPFYQRIQEQWSSGQRPPLWDPAQNGGIPLLGNPTAAVLYPGKVVYAILPFPWANRVYLVGHVLIAFATMSFFLKKLRLSPEAATIGGLSYAFGGPVLFQTCNVIYLVGAAWLPLSFLAMERWVRRGERRGISLLALSMSLQILGGDLEIVYLTGIIAALLGVGIHCRPLQVSPLEKQLLILLAAWTTSVLGLAVAGRPFTDGSHRGSCDGSCRRSRSSAS